MLKFNLAQLSIVKAEAMNRSNAADAAEFLILYWRFKADRHRVGRNSLYPEPDPNVGNRGVISRM